MTWNKLTENDCRESKPPRKQHIESRCVQLASYLEGHADVDDAPAPAMFTKTTKQ